MSELYGNVMIDLETLGKRPGCAILSIGAVAFDPLRGLGPTFSVNLMEVPQREAGLEVDADTVLWWERQSRAAYEAARAAPVNPAEALRQFKEWWWTEAAGQKGCVWGNGASFDAPILEAVFRAFGQTEPWGFMDQRCYRTLKNLFRDIKPDTKNALAHSALADAVHQAEHAVKILELMGDW